MIQQSIVIYLLNPAIWGIYILNLYAELVVKDKSNFALENESYAVYCQLYAASACVGKLLGQKEKNLTLFVALEVLLGDPPNGTMRLYICFSLQVLLTYLQMWLM